MISNQKPKRHCKELPQCRRARCRYGRFFMMGNDMHGMMKMMDECSRMMQSMHERRGSPSPDRPQETPLATKVAHTACCCVRVRTCGPQFSPRDDVNAAWSADISERIEV
jgi:hypothetical protein